IDMIQQALAEMAREIQKSNRRERSKYRNFLLLLLLLFPLATISAPRPAANEGSRFLFVVETSTAMLPFEHAGRQVVFDLIFSGANGQMQSGDTIGIWTFGDDLRAGVFPMQGWTPEHKLQLAGQVGLFLK